MMEEIELMLRQFVRRDAEAAQRAEAGVDAINGAGLRGERFDEFAAAADERAGVVGQRAGRPEAGDLPCFRNGKFVAVERNHEVKNGAAFYNKLLVEASAGVFCFRARRRNHG